MAPRKPTFDLKAPGCAELEHFDLPYAVKEYIQNIVGQVLNGLKQREWSDWTRLDIRPGKVSPQAREKHKQLLVKDYPGLRTGPDGVRLKKPSWLPSYILSATIPYAQIKLASGRTDVTTDLKVIVVLWGHKTASLHAMSFFNNHLHAGATLSSFAVDGESTSKGNLYAVGEKGKGFPLTTQLLLELVLGLRKDKTETVAKDQTEKVPPDQRPGMSGRVGNEVWTTRSKNRKGKGPFQIVLDDLTQRTDEEYVKHRVVEAREEPEDDCNDLADAGHAAEKRIADVAQNAKLQADKDLTVVNKRRVDMDLDRINVDGTRICLVQADEVCITVIGLPGKLEPEYVFGGIYGIIPSPNAWRVVNSPVQFFIAAADGGPPAAGHQPPTKAKFYHRDQYVKHGPHLNRVSINYHGDLSLTAERVAILNDIRLYLYRGELAISADQAIRTIPELAVQLALDILSDSHTEGLANLVRPKDTKDARNYRDAFEAAMRQMHPEIPANAPIYSTTTQNDNSCRELGFTPVLVSTRARSIMCDSGAYVPIMDYARKQLLVAPAVPNADGLKQLRAAIALLVPNIPLENVTVREYRNSFPTVVWDFTNKVFAFSLPPKCADHPETPCLCWIGPVLHDAAQSFDGGTLKTQKFFRAYHAMLQVHFPDQAKAADAMDVDIPAQQPRPAGVEARPQPAPGPPRAKTTIALNDLHDDDEFIPSDVAVLLADKGKKRAHVPDDDSEESDDAVVHAAVSGYLLKHRKAREAKLKTAASAVKAELEQSNNRQKKQLQTQLDARNGDYAILQREHTTLQNQHARIRQIQNEALQKRIAERDAKIAALDTDLQKSTAEAAKWKEEGSKLQNTIAEQEADIRKTAQAAFDSAFDSAFESRKRPRVD
ncbi:hypothetical protein DFH09DRAFT_1367962 [Mycena vulgaris]|nr:hypothetical protein DFH09DRAFT_1367962 [Mycena vulgaris]